MEIRTMDQQPKAPVFQPPAGQASSNPAPTRSTSKIIALWLLIGPTALIVGSILLYAIVNFIIAGANASENSMHTVQTVTNIILFILGAISFTAWLPGIIIGIVLLTTQKKA
jgi:hypothetical protein